MSLIVGCSKCGKKYKVGDDKAGKKIKCGGCGAILAIPLPTVPEPAAGEEVDLWDLPPAEDSAAPRLPPLPKRSGPRKTASKSPRSSKSKDGKPIWAKVLTIVCITMSVLGVLVRAASYIISHTGVPGVRNSVPAAPVWAKYTEKEEGFEIEFPSQNVKVEPVDDGKKYAVEIPGSNVAYVAGYVPVDGQAGTTDHLKQASDSTIANMKGQLISRKEISVAGNPGIQSEYSNLFNGKPMMHSAREILVKDRNRAYLFEVAWLKDADANRDNDRFFNSFRLLPR